MDKDFQDALLRNLIMKTRIMIIFFCAVIVIQVLGILILNANGFFQELPTKNLILVPILIVVIVIDEIFILRHFKKVLRGESRFRESSKYIVSILEISYPTLVLFFGSTIFTNEGSPLTLFMFFNSPPFVVYFVIMVLTAFYLDFKVSLITGLVAIIQYGLITGLLLEPDSVEFSISISKVPFILVVGIITGLVGKKLKDSVISSLEAKNTLINELDKKVAERTGQIEQQKQQLAEQNDLLHERNQEITDSIVYAKRIQNTILPADDFFHSHLKQSFVMYRPKDIVAGDFYWMQVIDQRILFAACDCTGHGVPGALVSVVCNNGLNRAVKEYGLTDPGAILNKTREIVLEEFQRSEGGVNDGMDVALCALENNTLHFAGANNPLWVIRKNSGEVEEIKGSKQPIGKFDKTTDFSTYSLELNHGDTFYVFSDGYADQFGGDRGKKFKASNLKKLLLSVQKHGMADQLKQIELEFENWKGNLEQLDDVCVIGVRV